MKPFRGADPLLRRWHEICLEFVVLSFAGHAGSLDWRPNMPLPPSPPTLLRSLQTQLHHCTDLSRQHPLASIATLAGITLAACAVWWQCKR